MSRDRDREDTKPGIETRRRRRSETTVAIADVATVAMEVEIARQIGRPGFELDDRARTTLMQWIGEAITAGITSERENTHRVQRELEDLRARVAERDTLPPEG